MNRADCVRFITVIRDFLPLWKDPRLIGALEPSLSERMGFGIGILGRGTGPF